MSEEFDRAMTAPIERVARVLAGHALSRQVIRHRGALVLQAIADARAT